MYRLHVVSGSGAPCKSLNHDQKMVITRADKAHGTSKSLRHCGEPANCYRVCPWLQQADEPATDACMTPWLQLAGYSTTHLFMLLHHSYQIPMYSWSQPRQSPFSLLKADHPTSKQQQPPLVFINRTQFFFSIHCPWHNLPQAKSQCVLP